MPPEIDFFECLCEGLRALARENLNSGDTTTLLVHHGERPVRVRTEPCAPCSMSLSEFLENAASGGNCRNGVSR